ncbi:hypothetical protein BDP55DRAFT_626596 [Colletotrichum godetiae]|uniref:Uncharacterized protein n=1 Tax=Colletotrichum godetiae TaxID=1209918 RepID=A0AAJ0AX48_9PEZI|nr:uncharacterized protein BDP55DRAFT_626596 [Colletotrichum godetiae]KAK1699924.1 hypothetical protein BDP55DRAFT_626596 [Colletotrichum godetiae]
MEVAQLWRHHASNTIHLIEGKHDAQGTNQSTLLRALDRKEGGKSLGIVTDQLGTTWFRLMQRPNVCFQNANERAYLTLRKIKPNSGHLNLPNLGALGTIPIGISLSTIHPQPAPSSKTLLISTMGAGFLMALQCIGSRDQAGWLTASCPTLCSSRVD